MVLEELTKRSAIKNVKCYYGAVSTIKKARDKKLGDLGSSLRSSTKRIAS